MANPEKYYIIQVKNNYRSLRNRVKEKTEEI